MSDNFTKLTITNIAGAIYYGGIEAFKKEIKEIKDSSLGEEKDLSEILNSKQNPNIQTIKEWAKKILKNAEDDDNETFRKRFLNYVNKTWKASDKFQKLTPQEQQNPRQQPEGQTSDGKGNNNPPGKKEDNDNHNKKKDSPDLNNKNSFASTSSTDTLGDGPSETSNITNNGDNNDLTNTSVTQGSLVSEPAPDKSSPEPASTENTEPATSSRRSVGSEQTDLDIGAGQNSAGKDNGKNNIKTDDNTNNNNISEITENMPEMEEANPVSNNLNNSASTSSTNTTSSVSNDQGMVAKKEQLIGLIFGELKKQSDVFLNALIEEMGKNNDKTIDGHDKNSLIDMAFGTDKEKEEVAKIIYDLCIKKPEFKASVAPMVKITEQPIQTHPKEVASENLEEGDGQGVKHYSDRGPLVNNDDAKNDNKTEVTDNYCYDPDARNKNKLKVGKFKLKFDGSYTGDMKRNGCQTYKIYDSRRNEIGKVEAQGNWSYVDLKFDNGAEIKVGGKTFVIEPGSSYIEHREGKKVSIMIKPSGESINIDASGKMHTNVHNTNISRKPGWVKASWRKVKQEVKPPNKTCVNVYKPIQPAPKDNPDPVRNQQIQ